MKKTTLALIMALYLVFTAAMPAMAMEPATPAIDDEVFESLYADALAIVPEGATVGQPVLINIGDVAQPCNANYTIYTNSNPLYDVYTYWNIRSGGGRFTPGYFFAGNRLAVAFKYYYEDGYPDNFLTMTSMEMDEYDNLGSNTAYAQNTNYTYTAYGIRSTDIPYRFFIYTDVNYITSIWVVALPYYA